MILKMMLLAVCTASVGLNLLFCGAAVHGKATGRRSGRRQTARKALAARKRKNRLAVKGTWKDVTFKADQKEQTA